VLEPSHTYRVDKRRDSALLLQNTCSVTGHPGDHASPFRSITPTPVPDDPPLDTPLLVAVSCTSAHVPFASLSSKPPSADDEKHDGPSRPISFVVFDPNDTRGHTSTDGFELPTLDD
jgi:hypothetical protein